MRTGAGPAAEPAFTVGNIRVEGLQRVSEGTVYNYLPVNIGDRLTPQRVREAIRALYDTGFFRDVEMRRDGATLVVVVLERPSIESFEIKGNKDIKTEDLNKSLRNVGLATGKTFDRSVLEDVKQFLTDQYFSRGKYAVRIDAQVEDVPGNRVKIKIDIKEGKRAKIRQINVVGNRVSRQKLLEAFELKSRTGSPGTSRTTATRASRCRATSRSCARTTWIAATPTSTSTSTQVAIAPEKDDIFVTVNVNEGEVFKLGEVKLAGTFVVPEEELKNYLLVKPGETYSKKQITATQELIQNRLGMDGYAFAKVDPVPTPDDGRKEVALTFFVDPGNRVYVRHIVFNGVTKINDEVLRREMRQLEGGWLSNALVERSKQRLQRLPYVEKVESETKPVPGSPDLVDVEFEIKEGPPGQFTGGIGYSESQSFILNGNYADSNFMGTGERISVDLNSGRYSKVYGVSHTNPYTTIDGVARTLSLTYRDVTQFVSASSDFSSETLALGVDYGYPITEFQALRVGRRAPARVAADRRGQRASRRATGCATTASSARVHPPSRITATASSSPRRRLRHPQFNTFELVVGWNYDSRNRALFADRGMRHSLSLSYTLPLSDVEYFTANYEYLQYLPLWGRWTLSLDAELGYGMDIGDTTALPPFRQFFAGGPDTVRGYRESRLGPKDSFGNPYGGNMKVVGRAEIIVPTPEKWRASARVSLFYDIGNVFSTGNRYAFSGVDGVTPVDYEFKYDKLKHSTGLAVQWLAPLGIFRFSYGIPLNAVPGRRGPVPGRGRAVPVLGRSGVLSGPAGKKDPSDS